MLGRQEILPTVARQGTEASWQRLCTPHISFFMLAELSFCHISPHLQAIYSLLPLSICFLNPSGEQVRPLPSTTPYPQPSTTIPFRSWADGTGSRLQWLASTCNSRPSGENENETCLAVMLSSFFISILCPTFGFGIVGGTCDEEVDPRSRLGQKVHPACKHLRYEGLRNKELYYNVYDKTHAAGAFGYGSVTMGAGSTPFVDYDFNFDNSGTHPFVEEDLTPSNGGLQANMQRGPDVAGPSRSRGSAGKRKQRDATDEMTFVTTRLT
ncbi:hypothetical protein TIFTF001_038928 [Ficus carica]|uniref:Uncharacterized protein n=1 Tax=Ficus carica TaxID=3494 RepID=A0AA88JDF3_FICCA|nr:hypothetical protein TIFTF001_038928 [Ficus carica]